MRQPEVPGRDTTAQLVMTVGVCYRRRLRLAVAALALAACCYVHGQGATPAIDTFIRGVEARGEGLSLRSRAVIAWMFNPQLVPQKAGFEPDPIHMMTPRRGFGDGVLDLSVADVAYDGSGERWRYEERAVCLSGMITTGWTGLSQPGPHVPRECYRYSVSDGDTIRVYDRSNGTLSVRPFVHDDVAGTTELEMVRWELLRTMAYHVPLSTVFGDEERFVLRYEGTTVLDAFPCHVWACTGREESRGCIRMWIAPELDFGLLRWEHVRWREDGAPLHANVTRWWEWDVVDGVPLHAPRCAQMDHFEYVGEDATAAGAGWVFSRLLVADGMELSKEP